MTRISCRLSTLCFKLKDWTDDTIPGSRQTYAAAISAKFPAHQVNGIWHVYVEDREAILEGLGLRPKASLSGRASRAATLEHASAA